MARGLIQSLQKGVELLFLFSEAEPCLSLTQISTRLRLPKSTSYRFIATLRQARLLVQEPETRLYRLGARLLSLPPAIVQAVDLRSLALPALRALMEQSGETAHLTERHGSVGIITEVVESPHVLRMAPRRGQVFLLHAGALCRAILAFLPPSEAAQVLKQSQLPRFTPNTPTRATLRRLLQEVRKTGVAVSLQEVTVGACGVSAPIRDPAGRVVASLGISGPLDRLTEAKRETMIEAVKEAAGEVSNLVRQHYAGGPSNPLSWPSPDAPSRSEGSVRSPRRRQKGVSNARPPAG